MDLSPEATISHDPSTLWVAFGVLLVGLFTVAGGVVLSGNRFSLVRLLGWLLGLLGTILLTLSGLSAFKFGVAWDDPAAGAAPILSVLFTGVPFIFLAAFTVKLWRSRQIPAA